MSSLSFGTLSCTGSDAWRQHASAVDAWSFGIMLLELGAGYLFSWVAPIGKIAFQPGRLDAAVPLSREALPANDDWFQALWEVAMQLLNAKPQNRPSMSVALLSDFFTSDQLSLEVTPTDRKFRTLNSHLDALRHSHTRLPARLIAIQSEATALTDMLTSFSATDLALPKAFSVSWGASGVRKPLQEAMDVVFSQLSHQQGAAALFQQCDEPVQVFRTYLPPAATNLSADQTQQYVAFGRMLVKCLLEGIHVPLNLSAAMHCMLVRHETLSSHADTCITLLASYDPAEAQRLRQLLAADHGDGDELMMSVGSVMGTDDESLVTDANKNGMVCRKVHTAQRLSQCTATSTPTCKHNACIVSAQFCFSTQTRTFGFQRTAGNASLSLCNLQVRVCSAFACFAQPNAY